MSSPSDIYDQRTIELINETATHEAHSEEFVTATKNLKAFLELPVARPQPEPTPITKMGKVRAGLAAALDNETTRTFLKAGGAFAGVALVVWSTVHRDHVMEKQAIQQANQRPI